MSVISLISAYIAFSFAFGFLLGPENFGKRHLVAELLQFSGGFGFLFFPFLHISEGLHIFDVYWNYLFKPYYILMIAGAGLAVIYKWYTKYH